MIILRNIVLSFLNFRQRTVFQDSICLSATYIHLILQRQSDVNSNRYRILHAETKFYTVSANDAKLTLGYRLYDRVRRMKKIIVNVL